MISGYNNRRMKCEDHETLDNIEQTSNTAEIGRNLPLSLPKGFPLTSPVL